jgi:hypothetical protein
MALNQNGGGYTTAEQPARQKVKKKEVNLQALAERILRLLKKEARLERERQGPR